ncbi:MAG: hypothetical protein ACRCUT_09855 [Spirochaetota bacterium]
MTKPDISRTGHELLIRHRWFSWLYLILTAMLFFLLIFIGLQGFISAMIGRIHLLISSPAAFHEQMNAMGAYNFFTSFMLDLCILIFILFVYYGLCKLFNTTKIRATKDQITSSHGPLPWPWAIGKTVQTPAVKAFSIARRIERTSKSAIPYYRVMADDGTRKTALTTWMEDDEPAKEMMNALAQFCGQPGKKENDR